MTLFHDSQVLGGVSPGEGSHYEGLPITGLDDRGRLIVKFLRSCTLDGPHSLKKTAEYIAFRSRPTVLAVEGFGFAAPPFDPSPASWARAFTEEVCLLDAVKPQSRNPRLRVPERRRAAEHFVLSPSCWISPESFVSLGQELQIEEFGDRPILVAVHAKKGRTHLHALVASWGPVGGTLFSKWRDLALIRGLIRDLAAACLGLERVPVPARALR